MKIPSFDQKTVPVDKDLLVDENHTPNHFYRIHLNTPEVRRAYDSESVELRQRRFDRVFLWTVLAVIVLCVIGIFISIGAAIYSHIYATNQRINQVEQPPASLLAFDSLVMPVNRSSVGESLELPPADDDDGRVAVVIASSEDSDRKSDGSSRDALTADANSVFEDTAAIFRELGNMINMAASNDPSDDEIFHFLTSDGVNGWVPESFSNHRMAGKAKDSDDNGEKKKSTDSDGSRKHGHDEDTDDATADVMDSVIGFLKNVDSMMDGFIKDTTSKVKSLADKHFSFVL